MLPMECRAASTRTRSTKFSDPSPTVRSVSRHVMTAAPHTRDTDSCPSRISTTRCARAAMFVFVGDQHDRASYVVQLGEQFQDVAAG